MKTFSKEDEAMIDIMVVVFRSYLKSKDYKYRARTKRKLCDMIERWFKHTKEYYHEADE